MVQHGRAGGRGAGVGVQGIVSWTRHVGVVGVGVVAVEAHGDGGGTAGVDDGWRRLLGRQAAGARGHGPHARRHPEASASTTHRPTYKHI